MNEYKEKIYNILKNISGNKRIMWLSIISVLILFTAALNITFSLMSETKSKNHANIIIGKLKYNMQVNNGELEDRILRISKNDTDVFHVNLTALNKYDTNYELIYHVCKNENCDEYIEAPSDLDILVSSKTINNIYGEIKSRESISITIAGINTNENEDYYIKLDLNAGYIHNELALVRQITHTYYEDDVTIIAIVDGEETSKFPTTGNYGVLYECMVGTTPDNNVVVTGTWDTSDVNNYHWRLTVDNVTKPRTVCNVTFAVKSLKSIAITTPPTKTTYSSGETFDPTGMILTGYFDQDGEEASVELSGYTFEPTGKLTSKDKKVTIIYMDGENKMTAEQAIVVNPILIVNVGSGSGGTASGNSYAAGSTVTLTSPTPPSGYVFYSWSVTSEDNSASVSGNTLTMGNTDTTVTANYLSFANMYTYTGSSQAIDDGNGNWRIKFFSSGTFTPKVNMYVDAFVVGGGGAGGYMTNSFQGGAGGAGGYTKTYKGLWLGANQGQYTQIGAGGSATTAKGNDGGQSYFISTSYAANGGGGGCQMGGCNAGGNGGSGGGCGSITNDGLLPGAGGSNGGNGASGSSICTIGYGQGSTTREFGDSTGALYAGGGGGGAYKYDNHPSGASGGSGGGGAGGGITGAAASGTANTGGGGGGGSPGYATGYSSYGGSGGSGIVIIRNHR